MRGMRIGIVALTLLLSLANDAGAATTIRIMPPDAGTFAAGQRFDIRVEAQSDGVAPPPGLRVWAGALEITMRNQRVAADGSPPNSAVFMLRGYSVAAAGQLLLRATT